MGLEVLVNHAWNTFDRATGKSPAKSATCVSIAVAAVCFGTAEYVISIVKPDNLGQIRHTFLIPEIGLSALAGTLAYLNFKDMKTLLDYGIDGVSKLYQNAVPYSTGKPIEKMWNKVFDYPLISAIPVTYAAYQVAGAKGLLEAAVLYAGSVVALKYASGALNYYSVQFNLSRARATMLELCGKSDEAKALMQNFWREHPRISTLVELRSGSVEETLVNANRVNFQGINYDKYSRVPLTGDPLRQTAVALIRRRSDNHASRLALARFMHAAGHNYKAAEEISQMVLENPEPESNALAFFFHHYATGNSAEKIKFMQQTISAMLSDPKYSREALGDEPSNEVFQIGHPLLAKEILVKRGPFSALSLEHEFTLEAYDDLRGNRRLFAPEPLFITDVNGIGLYVRMEIKGQTLKELHDTGQLTYDDLALAWELTERMHRGLQMGQSKIGYLDATEKIAKSTSAPYLNLPYEVRKPLILLGEPIEAHMRSYKGVNTDGHLENRLRTVDGCGIIDLEDRGIVFMGDEAASLINYVELPIEWEEEFARQSGLEMLELQHSKIKRAIALACAWSSPSRPKHRAQVKDKIAQAMQAISDLRQISIGTYRSFQVQYGAANAALEQWQLLEINGHKGSGKI